VGYFLQTIGINTLDLSKEYTKEKIIEGIIRGDSEILKFLYQENFRKIRFLITTNNGSEVDAEDIFQETLVVLFRKLRETNYQITSSLNTFIYAVARTMWLKELNSRKIKAEIFDTEDSYISDLPDIIDLIEKNERLKLFREKFEELSNDCKKVLNMFLNNLSIKDITRIMGYSSEQHTKNRQYRCKKSLIEKIKNSNKYKELGNEANKKHRDFS
jgi:RNA polymerase sigma factor (sigma-70 family)